MKKNASARQSLSRGLSLGWVGKTRCRLWLLVTVGQFLAACGGESAGHFLEPVSPEKVIPCEDLSIQDPRTGGNYTCLYCRRVWNWDVQASSGSLRLLIELACVSTPLARLRLTSPDETTLWQEEVHSGEAQTFCVEIPQPRAGRYTLSLEGDLGFGLTHFTGSIWCNLYDDRGEILAATGANQKR